MIRNYTILLEEKFAQRNFSAYVPELRLNAVGDTEKETLDSIRDQIQLHLKDCPNHKVFASKVVTLRDESDSFYTILLEEDHAQNNISAYVPDFRLNVVGDTEEETLDCIRDLILLHLEKSVNHKKFVSTIFSTRVVTDSALKVVQEAV